MFGTLGRKDQGSKREIPGICMWLLREDLGKESNLGWAWKDGQVLERSRVGRENVGWAWIFPGECVDCTSRGGEEGSDWWWRDEGKVHGPRASLGSQDSALTGSKRVEKNSVLPLDSMLGQGVRSLAQAWKYLCAVWVCVTIMWFPIAMVWICPFRIF